MQTPPESFPVFRRFRQKIPPGKGRIRGRAGERGRFLETSPVFLSGEVLEIPALCAILYTVKQNI